MEISQANRKNQHKTLTFSSCSVRPFPFPFIAICVRYQPRIVWLSCHLLDLLSYAIVECKYFVLGLSLSLAFCIIFQFKALGSHIFALSLSHAHRHITDQSSFEFVRQQCNGCSMKIPNLKVETLFDSPFERFGEMNRRVDGVSHDQEIDLFQLVTKDTTATTHSTELMKGFRHNYPISKCIICIDKKMNERKISQNIIITQRNSVCSGETKTNKYC